VQRICALPARATQRLHALMALALERTSDVVEITNPRAVFQYVNPAWGHAVGIPASEAIGKTPAQLVRSDAHSPEFFRELDAPLSAGKVWTGILISKARSGRLVHFDSTIVPIMSDGTMTHHIAVKRDITDEIQRRQVLIETNRALEQARDTALAASRAK